MTDDSTLGGYLKRHSRPPAFEGSDGVPYSVDLYVDETQDVNGQFGAAILFVRWSEAGDAPVGHLETDYLAHGRTAAEAQDQLQAISLQELKDLLDRLIGEQQERADW